MPSHAKRHHFVPQRVVRAFASSEASDLVATAARTRVRAHDEAVLCDRKRASKWPVIVADLSAGSARRLRRSTVLKEMQRDHLYGVADYPDPIDRGIAAWLIDTWAGDGRDRELSSEAALVALGESVHLPSLVEERILAPFDGRWAQTLARVEAGRRIDHEDLAYLRVGLQVAQLRSPTWKAWLAKSMEKHLDGPIGRIFGIGDHPPRRIRDLGAGVSNQRVGEILLDNKWVLAVVGFARRGNSAFIHKRVRILHVFAAEGLRFLLPDSPVRPFVLAEPESVLVNDNLGFARGDTVGLYPLSGGEALMVTADTRWPSHRVMRRHLTPDETLRCNLGMLLGSSESVILPCLDPGAMLGPRHSHLLRPPEG